MGSVTIALIIVAVWIGLLVFVFAMCAASGRADADEARWLAEGRDDVSNESLAPHPVAVCDERRSIDAGELEREAERLRIALPERPRLHVPRLVGARRHRS
jgi:hypothetical protein